MNQKLNVDYREINKLQLENIERGFSHFTHSEDMLQYEYLQEGNLAAVTQSTKMFHAEQQGCLSKDPVRNIKYLFVANTALASRFAVEAGIDIEVAYAISDLYIQKMDQLNSINDICILREEMFAHYTNQVAKIKKKKKYSKPVILCMNYIKTHLDESIHLRELAELVNLNPNYLTSLFKKEVHKTIGNYILENRIEAAKNMLIQTDFSYAQISSGLGFSSQSHFTRVFREQTGYTPKIYRNLFFDHIISSAVNVQN